MDERLLTVEEVAELMNVTTRLIRYRIKDGTLAAIDAPAILGGGKQGQQKLVPLSALSEKHQLAYRRKLMASGELPMQADAYRKPHHKRPERQAILATFDRYIDEQARQGIGKLEAIQMFLADHPDMPSRATLYRWLKQREEGGGEEPIRPKGHRIPAEIWQVFEHFWLDEGRPTIAKSAASTRRWAELNHPELLDNFPCTRTFARAAARIPDAVVRLARYGDKAAYDRALPYLMRDYDGLRSNEIWVADYRTLDVASQRPDGSVHRLSGLMIMDVRSRKVMSYTVSDSPNSATVVYGLRKAIERFGIPEQLYLDNGREFTCWDVAGKGFRARGAEVLQSLSIVARLGIKVTNAIPHNARAKVIERLFREFKDGFDRVQPTFTGGNVVEKPERLKHMLKSGKIVQDADLREMMHNYIEGIYNLTPQHGSGMRGKPPNEVYAENLERVRRTGSEELRWMMMRLVRPQTYGRNGVSIEVEGVALPYWSKETMLYVGRKVIVYYDPEDLRSVWLADEHGDVLAEVPAAVELLSHYGADKEELEKALSTTRAARRELKQQQQQRRESIIERYGDISASQIDQEYAKQAMTYVTDPRAEVVELIRYQPEMAGQMPAAVGDEAHSQKANDLRLMVEAARREKEKERE